MFAIIVGNQVYVTLSQRNLRQLNGMLHDPDGRNRWLSRRDENGLSVIVMLEDDADHYDSRDPGPHTAPNELHGQHSP